VDDIEEKIVTAKQNAEEVKKVRSSGKMLRESKKKPLSLQVWLKQH